MMQEFMGMLSIFLLFGFIPIISLFYLNKIKAKKLDTLIKLVELGGNVDPEMMAMLSASGSSYKSDYKWGLIWLAIGIPVVLGMLTVPFTGGVAFALIPSFLGLAYLLSGKLRLSERGRD